MRPRSVDKDPLLGLGSTDSSHLLLVCHQGRAWNTKLTLQYFHMRTFIFKTGSASEYHRALARSAIKGHVPYEAIFFDLLRAGNIGSRGVRSERKTSYRPPH